jgi:HlyD family type I secretion membrane fusion protein
MTTQSELNMPPVANSNFRPFATMGLIVLAVSFGGIGIWSATAPLGQGAVAPGVVAVASSTKTIQHLEGGIVEKVLVKEGDAVKAGEVLVQMRRTESNASREVLQSQAHTMAALRARLVAERDDQEVVTFSNEILLSAETDPVLGRVLTDERRTFEERRNSMQGQIALMKESFAQLKTELEGLGAQREGVEIQHRLIGDELVGLRELYEKGYYPLTNILQKEREQASLKGSRGRLTADMAKAEQAKGETRLKIDQLKQQRKEEVVGQLQSVTSELKRFEEQLIVAEDILLRVDVVSPIDGVIQNVQVKTEGGVLRTGEAIMDVVPVGDDLVISAQATPQDIDGVALGQNVEVRFSSLNARMTPVVIGKVTRKSPDTFTDERSGFPYYRVRVVVPDDQLTQYIRGHLIPGLPVETIITTGERTFLNYLIKPLADSFATSMTED